MSSVSIMVRLGTPPPTGESTYLMTDWFEVAPIKGDHVWINDEPHIVIARDVSPEDPIVIYIERV